MQKVQLAGKKTLLEIKRTTNVTTQAIAERAQLPIADVFAIEAGGNSTQEKVQKVIAVFNQLSGKHLTVDDIKVTYISEGTCGLDQFHQISKIPLSPFRPGLADALRPVLQAHGGNIEETMQGCLLTLPPGSTRQRLVPEVWCCRYDICFPDGYKILYVVNRNGGASIQFDPRDLPQEVINRFG